ncbi:MAG: acyltransferase family protein, partial [Clostridia bacterium]|nr:acyltransferase family protein [Clostridia bacterium]
GMQDTALYFNRLPAMLDVYANGMMFAWLYAALKKRAKPRWWTGTLSLFLCAGALAAMWLLMDMQSHRSGTEAVRMGQMLYRFPLSVAGGVFLAAGSLAPAWFQWLWSNRLVRFFAGISYNLYIWHQHLALRLRAWHVPPYADEMPQRAGEQPWQTLYTWLCFAGAVLVAALLTYTWERPLNQLGASLFLGRGRHSRKGN